MIDKTPPSNGRARMDLDSRQHAVELREDSGQQRKAPIEPVRGPMQQNGMKARITEEDLQRALSGWISAKNGIDLFPESSKHTALV
jgi:hypothetical protein